MDLVTPSIGLIIWQSIIFVLLVGILGKFAWRPILKIISTRDESIAMALKKAKEANEQIEKLNFQRQEMLDEIYLQREQMLQKTRQIEKEMEQKAKENAKNQAELILKKAKAEIENQKLLALSELKNQTIDLSIKISEKILSRELKNENQLELLEKWMKEEAPKS